MGQKTVRPAMLSRVFWSAAAVFLFAVLVSNLFREPWQSAPVVAKDGAPKAHGKVLWKERAVRLDVAGLPPLPAGKVYQLWHLTPNVDPRSTFHLSPAGKLDGTDTVIYDIVKGHIFAVTIEPEGGSKTPTMPICFVATVP